MHGDAHRSCVGAKTMGRAATKILSLAAACITMVAEFCSHRVGRTGISTSGTSPLIAMCRSRLPAHSYGVSCVSFADSTKVLTQTPLAGQSILASGSVDETVRIWDCRAKYGGRITSLRCGSPVLSLTWGGGSITGDWLAAGGGIPPDDMRGSTEDVDGWIRVWDVRTWKIVADCNLHEHANDSTYFSSQEHQMEVLRRTSLKGHSRGSSRAEGDAQRKVAHTGTSARPRSRIRMADPTFLRPREMTSRASVASQPQRKGSVAIRWKLGTMQGRSTVIIEKAFAHASAVPRHAQHCTVAMNKKR